ncbi:response regulator [Deinococcus petrolearius]|uniref:Response regulator n=1 Tax=Deinococcus petrolearius TaxID=1751295 RepID=A0ABW1DJC9_9DEIO
MKLLRVLLVDDNPEDILLAREVFQEHEARVDLTTCESALDALEHLRRHAGAARLPDVVLLDINMPGMSGFELLRAIKEDAGLSHIPVVMLTTSGHPRDVQQAYTLHASSYLMKSENFQGFMEQIDAFVTYWQRNRLRHWPQS